MRVIAGQWKGHRLPARVPPHVRPTQDAVRQALFDVLSVRIELQGMQVMDLFAGTGALGIEALSRGASFCTFVDSSPQAVAAIERNCNALGIEQERYRVVRKDACVFLRQEQGIYQLCIADPPYQERMLFARFGEVLHTTTALAEGAIVVIEHEATTPLAVPRGYHLLLDRRWGDTAVTILERQ